MRFWSVVVVAALLGFFVEGALVFLRFGDAALGWCVRGNWWVEGGMWKAGGAYGVAFPGGALEGYHAVDACLWLIQVSEAFMGREGGNRRLRKVLCSDRNAGLVSSW